jgi:hypothetical protein
MVNGVVGDAEAGVGCRVSWPVDGTCHGILRRRTRPSLCGAAAWHQPLMKCTYAQERGRSEGNRRRDR